MFQKIFDLLVIKSVTEDGISYYPSQAGNAALFLVIAIIFLIMLIISGSGKKKIKVQQLVFSSAAMTLAVITSLFTVFELPYGGSITLFRMFFICLIGYLYGSKAGILTGIAYGFLDLILEPYVIHPVQLLLDYPIAFGCLGLSGIFSKSGIIKGYILGVTGRFVCHFLTGIIFFSSYAGDQNPTIYSLIYNASYIVPEAIATVLILTIPIVRNALGELKHMATGTGTYLSE